MQHIHQGSAIVTQAPACLGSKVIRRVRTGITVMAIMSGVAFGAAPPANAANPVTLVGTFTLTPGTCNPVTKTVTGSYFRLIFPHGNVNTGFFFENTSSPCTDKSYTILKPGAQGGLATGTYQRGPRHAFTPTGNARANAIVQPVLFATAELSLFTQPIDPQTGRAAPPPSVVESGGRLRGQVEALSLAWNKVFINQGSPKPGGVRPGLTVPVKGTYNARTHAFVLAWTSQIVGGPFTGFIGLWYLTGTFTPPP